MDRTEIGSSPEGMNRLAFMLILPTIIENERLLWIVKGQWISLRVGPADGFLCMMLRRGWNRIIMARVGMLAL